MIIVDNALRAREAEGRPIRVGHSRRRLHGTGSGEPDRATACRGWSSSAVYARQRREGGRGLPLCGREDDVVVDDRSEIEDAMRAGTVGRDRGRACCSAAPSRSTSIVDVTGSVELGARVALEAFAHGKHVVAMNAELDATIGPILQRLCQAARRHLLGVRRRRARPADEPLPLGRRDSGSSRA